MISATSIQSTDIADDAKALLFALLEENITLRRENEALQDQERLISTKEAMQVMGCARKKFWELTSESGFPQAIKFGHTNHYKLNELKAFRDDYKKRKLDHAS
jgi:predicted DNA-binding transcriptional regulator AlpA